MFMLVKQRRNTVRNEVRASFERYVFVAPKMFWLIGIDFFHSALADHRIGPNATNLHIAQYSSTTKQPNRLIFSLV